MQFFFFGIALGVIAALILLALFGIPYLLTQCALGVRDGIVAARSANRETAARIRAAGRARREKDLAWMERHWATAWCARLNRRLLG
jgi:hypothetical protein